MTELESVFKALSDGTRLRILGLIFRHGHLCVCEVERLLGLTQSTASRHLRYLRDTGVLEDRREGAVVNYRLVPAPSPDLEAVLDLLRRRLEAPALPDSEAVLARMRTARDRGPGTVVRADGA